VVLKEERDLNGDGVVGMGSYLENWRLLRRDLSAAGLKLASALDQLRSSIAVLDESSRTDPERLATGNGMNRESYPSRPATGKVLQVCGAIVCQCSRSCVCPKRWSSHHQGHDSVSS
jgi:hypothetical protein